MSGAENEPPERQGDNVTRGRRPRVPKGDGFATGRKARSSSAEKRAGIPGNAGALKARPGYKVGYAKPPEATRFQKGISGNPRGRPKGSKNLAPALNEERMSTIILEEAYRKITVRDGTRTVTVPIAQAVMRALSVNALKGHYRAQQLFTTVLLAAETSRKALHDEWLNAAIQYKTSWENELHRRRALGITHLPDPLPHPDHVRIDLNLGTARIIGPSTPEEKAFWDKTIARKDEFEAKIQLMRTILEDDIQPQMRAVLEAEIIVVQRILTMIGQAERGEPLDVES